MCFSSYTTQTGEIFFIILFSTFVDENINKCSTINLLSLNDAILLKRRNFFQYTHALLLLELVCLKHRKGIYNKITSHHYCHISLGTLFLSIFTSLPHFLMTCLNICADHVCLISASFSESLRKNLRSLFNPSSMGCTKKNNWNPQRPDLPSYTTST